MPDADRPAACAIAVMAKASSPGRTKTRLCPPLSLDEAAELNTSFLKDIAANIAHAARRTPIASYMAYGPPGSDGFFREHLGPDVGLIEAWLGDFGACLAFAIEAMFARGHRAACVLNADSPTLPTSVLVDLAEALAAPGDRLVLGPAEDGGYYAMGLKASHRRLFEDVAWSTERVFDQTLERAAEIGLPVKLLPVWYDVDDASSLRRVCDDLFAPQRPGGTLAASEAVHTRRRLGEMMQDSQSRLRLQDMMAGLA